MCFASSPNIQKPTPPPSIRDASIEGTRKRQQSAGDNKPTSMGDPSTATTAKSTLGGA